MRENGTLLFCTSYIPSVADPSGFGGLARWRKWIDYYTDRKLQFGADRFALIDDGSPLENLSLPVTIVSADRPLPEELPSGVLLFRFEAHLGRHSMYRFPGWWRSFTFASELQRAYRFRKLIHVESDAYVISPRLAAHLKALDQGWTAFLQAQYRSRLARWRYPRAASLTPWENLKQKISYSLKPAPIAESAIQVICADYFKQLAELWSAGPEFWGREMMAEAVLPFSSVDSRFIGNRYGESSDAYPAGVDFVTQARTSWDFTAELTAAPPLRTNSA